MRNILITSAGRRVALVRAFQRELAQVFPGAKVVATDANPHLASACQLADKFYRLPSMNDPAYMTELLDLAYRERIGLILPTIDHALLLFAAWREAFAKAGVELLACDVEFARVCRDKRLTQAFFVEHGVPVPPSIDRDKPHFPMFVKPFDGSSSMGACYIASADEMTASQRRDEKLLYLEAIDRTKYDEFTLDLYYTRDGELKCVVPRKRLEVRAGEVSKAVTVKNELIPYIKEHFGRIAGARGCVTMQLFRHRAKAEYYGIEINPRFGGGYPLSYKAGANFPQWLIREYFLKERPSPCDDWEENLLMLRYDEELFLNNQPDYS